MREARWVRTDEPSDAVVARLVELIEVAPDEQRTYTTTLYLDPDNRCAYKRIGGFEWYRAV